MNIEEFTALINGSKQYRFDGTVLTVTGYYTGKQIRLDLSKIDEEMLEALIAEDEDDEY